MKLFTACLGTETNTFSPMPTGHANFAETYLRRGGDYGEGPFISAVPLMIARERAQERGWSVAESLCAFAQPAGVTLRRVYEGFRDEILEDLRGAMPVDIVFYSLHGAMVAEGYDDCEGDLLARTREIVGPDVPIGAELDLHCHLTQKMVDNTSALIAFKEYPHVDFAERAEELFTILADAAEGAIKPAMSMYNPRMIGIYHTPREPMRGYVDRLTALEGQDGVLSISVGHGFPWADVPDMGTRILVITDVRQEHGGWLAEGLGRELYEIREALRPPYLALEAGLDRALAAKGSPVVLADVSDNAGGGAASDSTFILRAMLERGIENAAVASIWDPIAVSVAIEAGVGAELDMRIGGKMGPMSGDPLDLHVTVTATQPDHKQAFVWGDTKASWRLGDTVAVRTQGIDIVLNSVRTQVVSPEVFSTMGIDPQRRRLLVVKSAQHFHAGFAPIASEVLYVAAPGSVSPDLSQFPFKRIDRDIWPFVEDPWARL
jgi:microcystin degradation protein MlrC